MPDSAPDSTNRPPVIVSPGADDRTAVVTLNRPEVRNAIDRAMADALGRAVAELGALASLRVVVVTGAGDRAFSAGADLTERRGLTPAERTAHTEAIAAAADALASLPVPTIAAVRGFALAGGAELAIACDLRVAAADAVIGFPEVRVGLFPGAGGVVRLPRLIGLGAARDLLFTGRRVGAEEALRLGLVDRVVPSDRLDAAARDLATAIAGNAPLALRALKRALREGAGLPEAEAMAVARRFRQPLDGTRDYEEGLAAFAEGRLPRFKGE